ncbi:MAG: hypothetical protein KF799_13350 [Bdellovibrionales bacterium]|nr:hypothetical protein [Bdellovibrionales bacterium]
MANKSFEEQYPGYALIPEKKAKRRLEWAMIWITSLSLVIAIPLLMLWLLGVRSIPTPNMASSVRFNTSRLASVATMQSKAGNHDEAVRSFARYFELGGQDANIMALYAFSLSELGRRAEAIEWSRKAIATSPDSKAAKMINDALEPKN